VALSPACFSSGASRTATLPLCGNSTILALGATGAHLGNGPWDDDLRSIPVSYLQDGGEFIVGLVNGRLVAMGRLRHITDAAAELKRMRVHPAFQRRGFGREILGALENRARELGYTKLRHDDQADGGPAAIHKRRLPGAGPWRDRGARGHLLRKASVARVGKSASPPSSRAPAQLGPVFSVAQISGLLS
jgi:GNAT superfamily N-acetyltransferase